MRFIPLNFRLFLGKFARLMRNLSILLASHLINRSGGLSFGEKFGFRIFKKLRFARKILLSFLQNAQKKLAVLNSQTNLTLAIYIKGYLVFSDLIIKVVVHLAAALWRLTNGAGTFGAWKIGA